MPQINKTPLHFFCSLIYGWVTKARNQAFNLGLLPSKRGELESLCVGNVVVGGSGKTPFSSFLANLLVSEGLSPGLLLRGYKSSISTPHIVSYTDSAELVGDEALLHRLNLSSEVPVCISGNRLKGIRHLNNNTSANVVVLDDGLQHRWLKPSKCLLLLNITDQNSASRWQNGSLLPYGHLREPLSDAIGRSDLIVLVSRNRQSFDKFPAPSSIPSVRFLIEPTKFIDLHTLESYPLDFLSGQIVDVATSIADPIPFIDSLKMLDATIADIKTYPDHHNFTPSDISLLCTDRSNPLIITEKDAVKLKPHVLESEKIFALKTEGTFFDESDSELFHQTCIAELGNLVS